MRNLRALSWVVCSALASLTGLAHAQGDLTVTSPLTLSSDQTFNNVTVQSGVSLTLNGHTLTVLGNFTVNPNNSSTTRHLIMSNAVDTLTVFGNALFRGANTLSDGVIILHGNLSEDFNNTTIQPGTPGTRFEFVGANPQTVTFATPGVSNGFLKDVAIFNTAGVTFATDAFITGQLKLEADAVLTQASTSELYFSVRLPDIAAGTYSVVNTRVNGAVTMIDGFTLESATNHLAIGSGTSLTLSGRHLSVGGNFTVEANNSSTAKHLIMGNAADTLTVSGNALFRGANTLSDGVIILHGNLSEDFNNTTIQPGTPGTRFEFVGDGLQTVTFATPAVSNAFLKDVAIFNTAGVTLATDMFITGQLKLEADAVLTQASTSELYFSVRLPDIAGGTYNVVNTRVNGAVTMLADLDLPSSANHLVIVPPNSLTLSGRHLSVGGNFTVEANNSSTTNHLILSNVADTLTVFGNALFRGHNTLSNGVIILHGNLSEDFNNTTIQPGTPGTRFEFVGANPQTVTFATPGVSNGFLKDVAIFNTAGVTLASDMFITGQLKLEADAVLTQTSASELYFSVRLPDIASGTYNVVNTHINGPVTMLANLDLPSSANHLVIVSPNSLTLSGHHLSVGGNFTVNPNNSSITRHLIMGNAADTLTVSGNALFRGANTLSDGVIILHGNLSEDFNNTTIQPGTPGTRFEFVGDEPQTVTFATPGASNAFFKDVTFENGSAGGISLNSNMVITGQMITSGAVTPTLFGNGRTVTATGVNVNRLVMDKVVLTINGGTITRFDRVTFQNYAPTGSAFTINHTTLNATFAGLKFLVTPTSGKYLIANDTNGGTPAQLTLLNAVPRDGSAFTSTTGGFIVNWLSTLEASDDTVETNEDEAVTIFPMDNDSNFTANPLTIIEVTQGAHGAVTIDPGDTTVTYTPDPDFNGVDTFAYTMGDTLSTDTGVVVVAIHPDADEPQITALPPSLDIGALLGTTATDTLIVINTGSEDLFITDIADGPLFGVSETVFTLAPGDTHIVAVTFEPADAGLVRDTLAIVSNDPSSPVLEIIVEGIGQPVGDVNGDGRLDVLDVVSLVNIILGRKPAPLPGSLSFARANVSEDASLNVLDVVGVINRILGLATRQVAGDMAPVNIALAAIQTLDGQRQGLPVIMENSGSLAGVQITLSYPVNGMRLLAPEPGERLSGMALEYVNTEGKLTVLIYSLEGRMVPAGDSPLLYLPVEIDPAVAHAEARIEEVVLAGAHGQGVATQLSAASRQVSAMPAVFALRQNRPNPFNPATEIAYELPRQTHVRLIVFNVLGQEVIRLVDAVQMPGKYAVIWNGKNGAGRNVSSGLYLYRIVTDAGFSATYRMTLVK